MTRIVSTILAGLLLLGIAAPGRAAAPRDELLRLVPADVGFCLVLQDLREHWSAVANSPFAKAFLASPASQALREAPEWAQLKEAEKLLREHLGLGWAELRDEIFGDAVVLAYRPGPPDRPEQEQGILLVRARNAEVLASTVAKLNQAQQKLGELKRLEERVHNGVKYFHRVEQNHAPYFYCIQGPILAASLQEELLKQAIDRGKGAAESPLVQPFRQLGGEQALLAFWLNPRAFEAHIAAQADSASAADAAFVKNLLLYWKAVDDVVLAVTPRQPLEITLGLRGRTEALPPTARKVFTDLARPSGLANLVPGNRVILAMTARVDFSGYLDALIEFLPEDARKGVEESLGKGSLFGKIYRDLLGQLGPEVAFAVVAPAAAEKQWTPHLLWALQVRPPPGGKSAQNVLDGLNFLAGLAILDYNNKHADRLTLKTEPDGDGEIKYFVHEKLYPPYWRPAYTLKKDLLLFASSPELIRAFANVPTRAPADSSETTLLHASLSALRTYLAERRDSLIDHIAGNQQISRDQAAQQLDQLQRSLQFLDRIELTQRSETGQTILTLRVKPSQPLRQ